MPIGKANLNCILIKCILYLMLSALKYYFYYKDASERILLSKLPASDTLEDHWEMYRKLQSNPVILS